MPTIKRVLIYTGHDVKNDLALMEQFDLDTYLDEPPPVVIAGTGPYKESVEEDINMIWRVNQLHRNQDWDISIVYGERIIEQLAQEKVSGDLSRTLFVIPPGISTHLDKAFSDEQIACIKEAISESGMSCLTHCGSAYWVSRHRYYETPHETLRKEGRVNLFEGTARGPLSPKKLKYGTDFYTEIVGVDLTTRIGKTSANILLSGGGTFIPDSAETPMTILATYSDKTLKNTGKDDSWKSCVISVPFGTGKAVLAMPIPASGEIDVEAYEQTFYDDDDDVDWKAINKNISTEQVRMAYANQIIQVLEE